MELAMNGFQTMKVDALYIEWKLTLVAIYTTRTEQRFENG